MISWITENVAIGDYRDACNRENLIKEKIDCIVDLTLEPTLGEEILARQNNIAYFHLPTDYIKRELHCACACLTALIVDKYERILVHCIGGIDRAPFIVALYLTRLDAELGKASGLDKSDLKFWMAKAYDFIQEKRKHHLRGTLPLSAHES